MAEETNEQFYRRYLSSFSHEMRNSLTLISSSLQIMAAECPAFEQNALWPQLQSDLRRLLHLLEDASSFTREQQHPFSVFSVQDFLKELTRSAEPMMAQHQIQLTLDLADEIRPLSICADRTLLREAFINLLINACEALQDLPPGQHRRILLTAGCTFQDSPWISFHVRDNGPGIPEEYLETLFDPFITHKAQGTGLGLPIVKKTAARHSGSVSVQTSTAAPDSFTDFCLHLPLNSLWVTP